VVGTVAGVRKFEDLIAWQLSMELCDAIFEITDTGPAARDPEFRAQIRDAAKKAPSLIAEGFLRFTAAEFIRYLRMARGEIGEVQNHLEFGRRRRHFTPEQLERATSLAKRAMTATSRLLKSKLPKNEAAPPDTKSHQGT
jgi:four helix bundle protein